MKLFIFMLVLQAWQCSCEDFYYYYDDVLPQVLTPGSLKSLDVGVKEKLINLISTKWDAAEKRLEANQQRYEAECTGKIANLETKCQTCAEKACEPSDLEKVKLLFKTGVKKVEKAVKKVAKEAGRVVKQTHEAVKKTVQKIGKGVKKVVGGVIKGIRKAARKVSRVVRRVVRRVVTRVVRTIRRIARVRVRIPRPRIRIRFRRRWGKRNEKRMESCALKCSSCQTLQSVINTEKYEDVCGPNTEGNRLINVLNALNKAYPSDSVPIITKVTRDVINGKEQTIVQMSVQGKSREVRFPSSFFFDMGKLQTACFNVVRKSYGCLI